MENNYLLTSYDKEFLNVVGLKWLPWIGTNYDNTKTVIVGESQYEDGDYWQYENIDATRILISKRFDGDRGKIYTNIEKVLLGIEKPTLEQGNFVWKSVVYLNLVQRLMSSRNERPNDLDFDNGWMTFFKIVEIIKPTTCIVIGKKSWGRFCNYLNNNENGAKWNKEISEFHAVERIVTLSKDTYQLKLIFINHASGSRGFDYKHWANLINESEPQLRQLLTHK